MNRRALFLLIFSALVSRAEVRFNRDIRPIMAETCFRCHGPDKNARMAGMRLDIRDEALKPTKSGVTPIVPGDPAASAIIQRIFAPNARVMPPTYIHKELTAAQKATIRQWVAEGAKYEGHWAYQPIVRPEVPGGANAIDYLVRQRLARENLKPSPEADRRTLIRRVSLDLTGLPPTPEEIAAFLADRAPDAYEKLVDRLLASPRYAEQQAIHWLDAVRYADTCGFHGDNALPAWPYRDYVLRAFRDNKPFDQFTREQIAGDLIPDAGAEQRVASAFNRLNRTSAEGGLQAKEYLAKYAADRVRTVSSVWMGSSLGCAECHDHKFDPILSRDFYSMKAFFADIKETGLVPDRGRNAWGSQIALATPEQEKRDQELKAELKLARDKLVRKMASLADKRDAWEQELLRRFEAGELAWHRQHPLSAKSANGAVLTIHNDDEIDYNFYDGSTQHVGREPGDGLVVASGPNPDTETYTVTFRPGAGTWTALGIEIVQDESLPGIRVARGADRVVISEVEAEVAGRPVPFRSASANLNNPSAEFPPQAAIDGNPRTGFALATYNDVTKAMLALRFTETLKTDAGSVMTLRIHQDSNYRRATIGRFRVALSSGMWSWPGAEKGKENSDGVLKALRTEKAKRTKPQEAAIAALYQWASPEAEPEILEVEKIEQQIAVLDAGIPHVVVSEAAEPRETRILPRGDWMNEGGDIVQPAIPVFLGKLDTGDRLNRLDLANWLVSPSNPLTARVFVNRLWRQFFGIGITKTLDDFGSQGEWPTNPELLDWLAAEFTQNWDVRHMIRLVVTSETYRQSSISTPELAERDPDNRLLARQSRFRVDAETVRDIALSVSGLLVERFGGPSVKPYEPDGYLATLNFPKREYSASRGDDLYRRGVYTFWQRSFLHPSLLTFDAPTREECTINRVNSNTPLQALVLLNDPIYVETARALAARILQWGRPPGLPSARSAPVAFAFESATGRAPTAEERSILDDLYKKSLAEFRRSPNAAQKLIHVGESPLPADLNPTDLAAMTIVARAILNMHETITRN